MNKREYCEALERAIKWYEARGYGDGNCEKDCALLRTLKERIERGKESGEHGIDRNPILIIDWSGREGEAG